MRKLALVLLSVFVISGAVMAGIITPDLAAKLNSSAPEELIPVMVTMTQQADKDVIQSLTAGMDKQATRVTVVGYLKDMAVSTQRELRSYLESLKNSGKISHVYPVYIVNMISLKATPEVIHRLVNFAGVDYLCYEPDRFALAGETVPPGPVEYGSDNTDEITWGVTDVHAPEVWTQGYNGTGIIVGMIDTGVNYNHLDLADHMWDGGPSYPNHGWNFYSNNAITMDGYSHGTHTAGTVASDGTAGTQAGVAPNATIMILKVLSDGGQGSPAQCIAGMNFAVDHGADLFSMSLGWYGSLITPPEIPPFRIACENLLAAGVPGAVCAGNENGSYPVPNNVRTPGRCPPPWLSPAQTLIGGISCVICCGATTEAHGIASFSSRGPSTWATYAPWYDYAYNPGMGLIRPDVSAPGVNTKSCAHNNNTGYVFMQGTSMATPHIAGAMALMLDKNPNLTPREIDSLLEITALDLGTAGKDNTFGAGLINALNAVNATPSTVPPALVVTITPTGTTTVPYVGGSVPFDLSALNNGPVQPYTVWARVKNPNGTYNTPNIGPVTINTPVGVTITRARILYVPGSWTVGTYYQLFYGNTSFSYPTIAADSFMFIKSPPVSGNGPVVMESTCGGELFPGEVVTSASTPAAFSLEGAYPNPFNPSTTIRFSLPEASKIVLNVFDVSGRQVAQLVNGLRDAGQHSVTFDGSNLSSGLYFYTLTAGQNTATGKLALVK